MTRGVDGELSAVRRQAVVLGKRDEMADKLGEVALDKLGEKALGKPGEVALDRLAEMALDRLDEILDDNPLKVSEEQTIGFELESKTLARLALGFYKLELSLAAVGFESFVVADFGSFVAVDSGSFELVPVGTIEIVRWRTKHPGLVCCMNNLLHYCSSQIR